MKQPPSRLLVDDASTFGLANALGVDVTFAIPAHFHLAWVEYLFDKDLVIDFWDGDSLLPIGSSRFRLISLLRQGEPEISVSAELPVIDLERESMLHKRTNDRLLIQATGGGVNGELSADGDAADGGAAVVVSGAQARAEHLADADALVPAKVAVTLTHRGLAHLDAQVPAAPAAAATSTTLIPVSWSPLAHVLHVGVATQLPASVHPTSNLHQHPSHIPAVRGKADENTAPAATAVGDSDTHHHHRKVQARLLSETDAELRVRLGDSTTQPQAPTPATATPGSSNSSDSKRHRLKKLVGGFAPIYVAPTSSPATNTTALTTTASAVGADTHYRFVEPPPVVAAAAVNAFRAAELKPLTESIKLLSAGLGPLTANTTLCVTILLLSSSSLVDFLCP